MRTGRGDSRRSARLPERRGHDPKFFFSGNLLASRAISSGVSRAGKDLRDPDKFKFRFSVGSPQCLRSLESGSLRFF
jgi:hypothetical protein